MNEPVMRKPVIGFHSYGHTHCDDGFGAALAAWLHHGYDGAEYVPLKHGEAPPLATFEGADVTLLDFSYKRAEMEQVLELANSVTILDHHKSAVEELPELLDEFTPRSRVVDLKPSGAVLAWQHFHPDRRLPEFFLYLQDRDTWERKYEGIDEFVWGLRSYPQTFGTWSTLLEREESVIQLIKEGTSVKRFVDLRVEALAGEAVPLMFEWGEFGSGRIPAVNAPMFLASELAGAVAGRSEYGLGVAWYMLPNRKFYISIRRRDEIPGAPTAEEVAKAYGGGGHPNAAGCIVDFDTFEMMVADGISP